MFGQLWRNMPDVTKNLIIINLILFLATFIIQIDGQSLVRHLALYYPGSENFEPYQIVSHMFMHGGLMHIFFNMFALLMFGSQLERIWGPKRFLFFYFSTGLGAVALHLGVSYWEAQNILNSFEFPLTVGVDSNQIVLDSKEALKSFLNNEGRNGFEFDAQYSDNFNRIYQIFNTPTVGASGAIFGLLMGFAMIFPNTELMLIFLPIPIKAKYFIPFYMAVELFLGVSNFSWDNIAHFAHLGGALFGFIIVMIWKRDRNNFW